MPSESGATTSAWMDHAVPDGGPLDDDLQVDVCVIGAGIAGLSVAYGVIATGRSVAVIEDGAIGGGETGRTTAHLSSALDDRYCEIEALHGAAAARVAATSHAAAIDHIESVVAAEGIDCGFARVDGYLFMAPGDDPALLDRELDAARRAGLDDVERLPRAPLDAFDTGPCLRFPRQGRFHPLQYLDGLATAIRRRGGAIYTGTHATALESGRPLRVGTEPGATVTADAVVVATNTPFNDRLVMHTKQAPYRTFVVALAVARGSLPDQLWWDTGDPYHYVRLQPQGAEDLLIVGGEDHKTGQADDADERFARLERWARERFAMAGALRFRWSGQVMEPVDYLGFIGRNPLDESVYICTGDSGHGMTHGTIAGMLLPDLVAGRPNAWAALYDPARKTVQGEAAREFARENVNVALQYGDWLRAGEVESVDEVPLGGAAILRQGRRRFAVHREDSGNLVVLSAVCPHLRCIVHWNHTERTWDCPCHGSRFDARGQVVNGPANVGLEPVSLESLAARPRQRDLPAEARRPR